MQGTARTFLHLLHERCRLSSALGLGCGIRSRTLHNLCKAPWKRLLLTLCERASSYFLPQRCSIASNLFKEKLDCNQLSSILEGRRHVGNVLSEHDMFLKCRHVSYSKQAPKPNAARSVGMSMVDGIGTSSLVISNTRFGRREITSTTLDRGSRSVAFSKRTKVIFDVIRNGLFNNRATCNKDGYICLAKLQRAHFRMVRRRGKAGFRGKRERAYHTLERRAAWMCC